ncbi:unnamed protein product, partial [Rotaria magnacalcarata]
MGVGVGVSAYLFPQQPTPTPVLIQGESYATICLVAPTVLGILFDLERELGSSTLTL